LLKKQRFRVLMAAVLFTILTAGCTTVGPVKPSPVPVPVVQIPEDDEKGWWYAGFKIEWPDDAQPTWYVDLILAHRVIAPVLYRYEDHISLWRFHRRAGRDQSGHRFSFIFYASPETAREIYKEIQSSELLVRMKEARIVQGENYDDTGTISRPLLEATSDRNWPSEIQKSWPFYIMGVSQMWLKLIDEVSPGVFRGEEPSSLSELQESYKRINGTIKEIWQKEGSHAFLHHLNALFGYEPLIVYERRLTNF
jgi:hypothetical protein